MLLCWGPNKVQFKITGWCLWAFGCARPNWAHWQNLSKLFEVLIWMFQSSWVDDVLSELCREALFAAFLILGSKMWFIAPIISRWYKIVVPVNIYWPIIWCLSAYPSVNKSLCFIHETLARTYVVNMYAWENWCYVFDFVCSQVSLITFSELQVIHYCLCLWSWWFRILNY